MTGPAGSLAISALSCRRAAVAKIVRRGLSFSSPCHAVQRVQRYLPLASKEPTSHAARRGAARRGTARRDGQWMDAKAARARAHVQLHNGLREPILARQRGRKRGERMVHNSKLRRYLRHS